MSSVRELASGIDALYLSGRPGVPGRGPRAPALIEDLRRRRRKLLDLHYSDRISAELFAEQEAELTSQLALLESSMFEAQQEREHRNSVAQAFQDVASHLADLDIDEIWAEASERERWVIASDLLDEISIHPDHLEVKVAGAPRAQRDTARGGADRGGRLFMVSERGLEPPRA